MDSQNDNTLSIVNNIFFYNNNYEEEPSCQFYLDYPNGDYNFINNCIEWLGCQIEPTNNFDFIPEFVNYTNNNFRLQYYSPLVDLRFINVFPKAILTLLDKTELIMILLILEPMNFGKIHIEKCKLNQKV